MPLHLLYFPPLPCLSIGLVQTPLLVYKCSLVRCDLQWVDSGTRFAFVSYQRGSSSLFPFSLCPSAQLWLFASPLFTRAAAQEEGLASAT